MAMPQTPVFVQCGREITEQDVDYVKEIVDLFSGLSRGELAHTICEHWGWVTASGGHKVQACLKLLGKLEEQGALRLPKKRNWGRGKEKRPAKTHLTDEQPAISGALAEVWPVHLEGARDKEKKQLWNEYVERYHYLGYKKSVGFRLRYFITSGWGILGCLLLAGPAKSMRVRDEWIGWTAQQRLQNLPWVTNNTRFLIFPWVSIRNLASHVLGQLARRVREDWEEHFGFRPVLMETFVDPARYRGISYKAAGWTLLGQTTGEGLLRRPNRLYKTTPKKIFVLPLVQDFREQLCSDHLMKGVRE
jgi:hypothetical protein